MIISIKHIYNQTKKEWNRPIQQPKLTSWKKDSQYLHGTAYQLQNQTDLVQYQ